MKALAYAKRERKRQEKEFVKRNFSARDDVFVAIAFLTSQF